MLRDAGRLEDAETDLNAALEIYRRIDNEKLIEASATLSALGQLKALQGKPSEAKELFEACLKIRRTLLPPDDERIGLVTRRLMDLQQYRPEK